MDLESRRTVNRLSKPLSIVETVSKLSCSCGPHVLTANQGREFLSQILDDLPDGHTDSGNDWPEAKETDASRSRSRFATGPRSGCRDQFESSLDTETVNRTASSSLDLVLIQSNQQEEGVTIRQEPEIDSWREVVGVDLGGKGAAHLTEFATIGRTKLSDFHNFIQ